MKKQQLFSSILLISLVSLLALTTGCSSSNTAGGTIETTNGHVANVDNSFASNAEVILIPEGFNPNTDDVSKLEKDTTDESGAYQLIIPASGSYNIEVRSLENGTRALLKGTDLSEKTDSVPLIQLTHPGVFIINVPDSLSEELVYYFSGTTYKWQRSQLDTAFDGSLVFANLPAGTLPPLESNITTLKDEVSVKSQDSVYYDLALTWRSFNTQNSSIPSDTITSIYTDNNRLHWIGTIGGGVGIHTDTLKSNFGQDKHVLSSNNVNDLVINKSGTTLIATDNGFTHYNDSTAFGQHLFTHNGLSSNFIKCIALDSLNNGCWLGTDKGLDYLNLDSTKFTNHLSGNIINDVTVDKNNNVWVATSSNGVYFFNGNDWTQHKNNLNDYKANVIIERSNGDIIVGHTNGKLSILGNNTWSTVSNEQSSAENQDILSFYETNNGTLYAGTSGGLIRNEDGYWKRTTGTVFDEIEEYSISSISDDADGNMWIGTQHNGVYVFGKNAQDIIFKRAFQLRVK